VQNPIPRDFYFVVFTNEIYLWRFQLNTISYMELVRLLKARSPYVPRESGLQLLWHYLKRHPKL
jgi:hypothetical protein